MLTFLKKKAQMPGVGEALPGRAEPIPTAETHFVNGRTLKGPYPEGMEFAMFGMGCFWGVERLFWEVEGVWVTSVGYADGQTQNPTYREVCSGMTGHNEVVRLVYDPGKVAYSSFLKLFWERHDPTQGMRQGNDVGTQYRSGIYTYTQRQREDAMEARQDYGTRLNASGFGSITTEIVDAPEFYFAENYHQQYLAKNPAGYCDLRGTGVSCSAA